MLYILQEWPKEGCYWRKDKGRTQEGEDKGSGGEIWKGGKRKNGLGDVWEMAGMLQQIPAQVNE